MTDIFFPAQPLSARDFLGADSDSLSSFKRNNARECNYLNAHMPYCLPGTYPEGRIITQTLGNLPVRQREQLMCTIDTFGDFTTTLAGFYDKNLSLLNLENIGGVVGAGTTASHVRLNGFQTALVNYQKSLIALHRQQAVGRGASAQKAYLQMQVRSTYQTLQKNYHAELRKFVSPNAYGKNRGNALSGADRGLTLAQRHKGRGLNVASNTQALQLARLANGINFAGKTIIMVDAGRRINGVHDTYKTGGNWQKEAAIQATGFGLGGAVGVKAGGGVVAGLTAIGLGLTPLGWVAIIGVGIAAGFVAAKGGDWLGTEIARRIYERSS